MRDRDTQTRDTDETVIETQCSGTLVSLIFLCCCFKVDSLQQAVQRTVFLLLSFLKEVFFSPSWLPRSNLSSSRVSGILKVQQLWLCQGLRKQSESDTARKRQHFLYWRSRSRFNRNTSGESNLCRLQALLCLHPLPPHPPLQLQLHTLQQRKKSSTSSVPGCSITCSTLR